MFAINQRALVTRSRVCSLRAPQIPLRTGYVGRNCMEMIYLQPNLLWMPLQRPYLTLTAVHHPTTRRFFALKFKTLELKKQKVGKKVQPSLLEIKYQEIAGKSLGK